MVTKSNSIGFTGSQTQDANPRDEGVYGCLIFSHMYVFVSHPLNKPELKGWSLSSKNWPGYPYISLIALFTQRMKLCHQWSLPACRITLYPMASKSDFIGLSQSLYIGHCKKCSDQKSLGKVWFVWLFLNFDLDMTSKIFWVHLFCLF